MAWIDAELALTALAATLSPTTLSFSIFALVLGDRPLRTGFWFYLGALTATLAIGVVAAVLSCGQGAAPGEITKLVGRSVHLGAARTGERGGHRLHRLRRAQQLVDGCPRAPPGRRGRTVEAVRSCFHAGQPHEAGTVSAGVLAMQVGNGEFVLSRRGSLIPSRGQSDPRGHGGAPHTPVLALP